MLTFRSPQPRVQLIGAFEIPFDGAMAAARTCYSSRDIVLPSDVAPEFADGPEAADKRRERRDFLARDLLHAGHHTVFQHAHFQFALAGVSRHLVWSFLHNHPFYNSEQVSQRYVTVREGALVVPDLGPAQGLWQQTAELLFQSYGELVDKLTPVATEAFMERFPARARRPELWQSAIRKRAQEIARYVLPIGTTTYLHHTISGLVLLRYRRAQLCGDLPAEQSLLVEAMVREVLRVAPGYAAIMQEPLPEELFVRQQRQIEDSTRFDALLEGRMSRLIAWAPADLALLDEATGWVVQGHGTLPYDTIVRSGENPVLAQNLNLSFQDRSAQLMHLVHYVFQKKLSHAADSQNQRHRLTPGARPFVTAHRRDEPDYITPVLVRHDDRVRAVYDRLMARLWENLRLLRHQQVDEQALQYLLPNAVPIRFYEASDLTALRHKMGMRLCYNAQEEIWQASVEEAAAIAAIHPEIGAALAPPCELRDKAGIRPACPEGSRFCGVPVWKLNRKEYTRII